MDNLEHDKALVAALRRGRQEIALAAGEGAKFVVTYVADNQAQSRTFESEKRAQTFAGEKGGLVWPDSREAPAIFFA